ncbi:MAG TPA: ketoacyl-ACP synthase III [Pseudomonadota bacterium]|nr:ketoacyl-ACP synthase III [Pseudomonadota bacterium]
MNRTSPLSPSAPPAGRPRILSSGRCVPAQRLDNADVEARLGEPVHDWLVKNVGIQARHIMADDQVTSDLVTIAARQALERAGLPPEALDLIILATDTPDYMSPGTSSVVQAKLGATRAGTFDVNCACAGWVTALNTAAHTMNSDSDYRYVLVAGGYGMSRFLDWKDKHTATLFADGAGAVILGRAEPESSPAGPGFLAGKLLAHGQYHDALGIYGGGTSRPSTAENVEKYGQPYVRFVKKFPRTFNTDHWPPLIDQTLAKAGLGRGDVDLYVFTQLNLRTVEAMMGILGQPMEKTHCIMDKWGYTGSACIPMALDDALQSRGLPQAGQTVMFCASGGGLAMATSLWRWG